MPKIHKASGPMLLFDPKEGKLGLGMEEAAVVKHPLLYVCGSFPLFPL